MGGRTVVQADKTELPVKRLLWENANTIKIQIFGDTYCQPAAYSNKKGGDTFTFLEFLRTCNHDKDYAYVIYYVEFYSLLNHPQKNKETLLNINQKENYQLSIF